VALTEPVKALLREAAQTLTGSERRRFLARTVEELGPGGQRRTERELGWSRVTIRKGQRERASGGACVDGFALRGRKRAEAHLPALLDDLEAVVVGQSQADPSFRTTRLYTRLTAGEVRRRLVAEQGYTDAELPCVQTIGAKLNALGYYPQTVAKTPPQAALERHPARFPRRRPGLCRHHDLEGDPPQRRRRHDRLRARRDLDQSGDGGRGGATHPTPDARQVVRRHPPTPGQTG